jgi:hypothetical protein
MKRRVLIGGGLAVLVVAAGAGYLALKDHDKKPSATVTTPQPTNTSRNVEVGDITTPEVSKVRADIQDPALRYAKLFSYALSKESVQKYDEAIEYFKSASEEQVEKTLQQDAQYRVYRLAKLTKNNALQSTYESLLGKSVINDYEQRGSVNGTKPE